MISHDPDYVQFESVEVRDWFLNQTFPERRAAQDVPGLYAVDSERYDAISVLGLKVLLWRRKG